MLVRDVMQTDLVTIGPDTTLPEAIRLAAQRGIRHLPVLEYGQLVGIVSDRDLKRAMASNATSLETHELTYLLDRLRVGEIMTRAVVTIAAMFPVEEAARLMIQERIGALPVTEGGRLIGIVSETDVLGLFVRAMGAGERSSRLEVIIGPEPAAMSTVVRILEEAGTSISSIVTFPGKDGARETVIRIATVNPAPAVAALRAAGYGTRDSDEPSGRSALA